MAIAKNENELEEIGVKDEANKIKHELPFFRDTKSFLRKINNDFETEYIATGQVNDVRDFKGELVALLLANYNKIAKSFKFNIRESFKEKTSPEIDAIINKDITKSLRELSDYRSDLILQTTNKQIVKEVSNTIVDFVETDKNLDNVAIAIATKKALNKKVDGRSAIIATAETQTSSEKVKQIEKDVLVFNDVILDGTIVASILKRDIWITMLDEKVRSAHAIAHGQEKSLDGFYLVGGELLKFPGDPNGSAGNIINCRCASVSKTF